MSPFPPRCTIRQTHPNPHQETRLNNKSTHRVLTGLTEQEALRDPVLVPSCTITYRFGNSFLIQAQLRPGMCILTTMYNTHRREMGILLYYLCNHKALSNFWLPGRTSTLPIPNSTAKPSRSSQVGSLMVGVEKRPSHLTEHLALYKDVEKRLNHFDDRLPLCREGGPGTPNRISVQVNLVGSGVWCRLRLYKGV